MVPRRLVMRMAQGDFTATNCTCGSFPCVHCGAPYFSPQGTRRDTGWIWLSFIIGSLYRLLSTPIYVFAGGIPFGYQVPAAIISVDFLSFQLLNSVRPGKLFFELVYPCERNPGGAAPLDYSTVHYDATARRGVSFRHRVDPGRRRRQHELWSGQGSRTDPDQADRNHPRRAALSGSAQRTGRVRKHSLAVEVSFSDRK